MRSMRKASPAKAPQSEKKAKAVSAALPGRATKKSAAADPVTKLKERLVRGERLTEDELVQLELATVSRYDALQHEEDRSGSRRSTASASVSKVAKRPPPAQPPAQPPPPTAAASRDGLSELEELRELRELRRAAQQERASLNETAAELRRLRELRLSVAADPQAAATLPSTRRLEARGAGRADGAAASSSSPYNPFTWWPAAPAPAPAQTVEAVSGIQKALRSKLAANHARVLDLFRTMDADNDGTVRACVATGPRHCARAHHAAPSADTLSVSLSVRMCVYVCVRALACVCVC